MKRTALLLASALFSALALAQMPDRGTWMAGGDDGGSGLPSGGFPWIVAGIWLAGIVVASFLPARAKTYALPVAQGWPLLFIVLATVKLMLR